MQGNLANTYQALGRLCEALPLRIGVYAGRLKLLGEEHAKTLIAANNYAHCLLALRHYAEAKGLLRKIVPVARRVLGDSHQTTLLMRWSCAEALYKDGSGSLGELREAVTTLEEIERVEQRVLGGAHPTTLDLERDVRDARAALRARETSRSA